MPSPALSRVSWLQCFVACLFLVSTIAAEKAAGDEMDSAYTRAITGRAEKIVTAPELASVHARVLRQPEVIGESGTTTNADESPSLTSSSWRFTQPPESKPQTLNFPTAAAV